MKVEYMRATLPKYEEYLYEEEKSLNTIKKYIRDIKKFIDFNGKEEIISKKNIVKFKTFIKVRYKISSANSIFIALNKYFEYLGKGEFKTKLLKFQKNLFIDEGRSLKKKDYMKLLETARLNNKPKLSLIIQTICSTGIRISELKYISVEAIKKGRVEVNLKGKSRVIFLPKKLIKKLEKYINRKKIKSGSIFVSKHKNSMDRSNIWRAMKNLGREAGIDERKVYPHNLRHLFATTYYQEEKDIVRLADVLGHSSIETTRIYTKISCSEYGKKVDALDLLYEG